jgi:hypothetical protein
MSSSNGYIDFISTIDSSNLDLDECASESERMRADEESKDNKEHNLFSTFESQENLVLDDNQFFQPSEIQNALLQKTHELFLTSCITDNLAPKTDQLIPSEEFIKYLEADWGDLSVLANLQDELNQPDLTDLANLVELSEHNNL